MAVFDIKVDIVDMKAFALDDDSCIMNSKHSFCSVSWGQAIKDIPVKQVSFRKFPASAFTGNPKDNEPVTAIHLVTEMGLMDIRAERLVVLNLGVLTIKGDGKEFSLCADSSSAWIAMQAAMHVFEDRQIVSDLLYPEKAENGDHWF